MLTPAKRKRSWRLIRGEDGAMATTNYEAILSPEVKEFLASLPDKLRAKTRRAIDMLENWGKNKNLGVPHSRKVIDARDLYELSAQVGADICRLSYFCHGDEIFVALSGFVKKKNKLEGEA
jgi:phage-related protein